MGSLMSKTMEESFKKNKQFMIEMQNIQLERQIHMQDQMRLRMQAMQIGRARDMFYWMASFYGVSLVVALAAVRRTKKRAAVFPILPLTFVLAYQADLAYGTKLNRIKGEADYIMQFEPDLLEQPCGVPTTSLIDSARQKLNDEKRYTRKVRDVYM